MLCDGGSRVDLHAQANFLTCIYAHMCPHSNYFEAFIEPFLAKTPTNSNQACLWLRVRARVSVPGRGGGRR